MQFEITDDAALTFAAYFYEALAQGDPVDGAVAHARLGIFASGNDVEWGTPVLFLRSADGRVFEFQGEQARSQEAELSLAFEAHPTVAAVGEPITWLLHIQNVGTPSLFRATPQDDAGRALGDPVDLMSGEDAVFTWSSTAELGPAATVSVTATEASGREVHASAQARLDVQPPPTAAMVLTLRPEPARAAIGEEIVWRLSIRGTGPTTALRCRGGRRCRAEAQQPYRGAPPGRSATFNGHRPRTARGTSGSWSAHATIAAARCPSRRARPSP